MLGGRDATRSRQPGDQRQGLLSTGASREVSKRAQEASLQDPAQPWGPEVAPCSGNFFGASCPGHLGARGVAGDTLGTDEGVPGLGASTELP